MKKLMIAAAAAAMIGGAYADLAYDYKETLKTTTGKSGDTKIKYEFNLGWDGVSEFWYQDQDVQDAFDNGSGPYAEYFKWKKVGGSTVPGLTDAAKADYDFLVNVIGIEGLAAKYNQKSAGKWCEQVKGSLTFGNCYRVAKTITRKTVVYVNDCCGEVFADDAGLYTIDFFLNNRFGAASKDKATKVEVCGSVNGTCDSEDAENCFTIAGQGTWKDKLATVKANGVTFTYAGFSEVSGNIVGLLPAPNCASCCLLDEDAFAWVCADDDATYPCTAAFGTWSIKFNKGKSDL